MEEKNMVDEQISPPMTLEGFNILKFIKGNRKAIVAGAAYLISLAISDTQWVAFLSSGVFAVGYTLIEFYLKKVDLSK